MHKSANDSVPHAVVIGAGPAGLAAAEVLSAGGACVRIHERMPSPGRKLLMAGRGGLNITHSEPADDFLSRYGTARSRLEAAIRAFSAEDMRSWCESLGTPTFVGTSGRVFPVSLKASPLLRAWLGRLAAQGVELRLKSRWTGWAEDGTLLFDGPDGTRGDQGEVVILALGGASWPRLGSDGSWTAPLSAAGVRITPFTPANCGFECAWSASFRERFSGMWIKPVRLRASDGTARGEALVTDAGIEGGGLYALSAGLREEIAREGSARLEIDLRPDTPLRDLAARLAAAAPGVSISNRLRRSGLTPIASALLREDERGVELPREPAGLAERIKGVRLRLRAPFGLARAISSAGGVGWDDVEEDFSVRNRPDLFVCGEMMDWEAPTGGYLLQACLATGRAAGAAALARLRRRGVIRSSG